MTLSFSDYAEIITQYVYGVNIQKIYRFCGKLLFISLSELTIEYIMAIAFNIVLKG